MRSCGISASEDTGDCRLLYIITLITCLPIKGFSQINPFWLTYYIPHPEKTTERLKKNPDQRPLAINIRSSAVSLHRPREALAPDVVETSSAKLFPSSKAVLTHYKVPKGPLKKKKQNTDPLLEVSSFSLLVKYEYLNQADESRSKHAACASPARSWKGPAVTYRHGKERSWGPLEGQPSNHFAAFHPWSSTFGWEGKKKQNSQRWIPATALNSILNDLYRA